MTHFRQSRWFSTLIVGVIALAWFTVANHCALAAFETVKPDPHACCQTGGTKPPVSPKQSVVLCCDTLNVTLPAYAAAPLTQWEALRPAWLESVLPRLDANSIPAGTLHATGPPRALGFAEIVLNRSLFSHAPPSFVA